jgi:excisionase family DNA binding protein
MRQSDRHLHRAPTELSSGCSPSVLVTYEHVWTIIRCGARFWAIQVIDEQMLTVAEAAEMLRVSPSTVRRWIREGEIRAYRIGRRRIGLRPSDLSSVVTPANTNDPVQVPNGAVPFVVPELTPEERDRGRAAVQRIVERHRAYKASGRSDQITPSWVLINEARDERSEQLADY